MKKFQPLIQYKRSNIIEKLHLGCVCAINSDKKIILNFGNIKTQSFLFRSAQKPFQCYNLLKNNIYKKFGLTDKSLAIFSGSHTGTAAHIDLLKEILNKTGIKQENIKCPKSYPLDEKTKTKMLINNEAPTNLHNNCSGKHLAMLINCKENDWNFSDYLNPNHPLQQEIFFNHKTLL